MKKVVMTMIRAMIVGSLGVTAFAHSNQDDSVPLAFSTDPLIK
ncbi:hypothetical protein [Brevibacillus brevis]|nr:hypothetical protein [Brevibacillus brevis]